MSRSNTTRHFQRGALWLLVAAWICANSPQAATYALISWVAHSAQFSHQQQLKREVAFLLVGESARGLEHSFQSAADRNEPPPAIPVAAVLKKLDLATEERVPPTEPTTWRYRLDSDDDWPLGTGRAAPPLGPPRGQVMA